MEKDATVTRLTIRRSYGLIAQACLLLVWAAPVVAIDPDVHEDRTVTFRIEAPDARLVQIDVKGKTSNENDIA